MLIYVDLVVAVKYNRTNSQLAFVYIVRFLKLNHLNQAVPSQVPNSRVLSCVVENKGKDDEHDPKDYTSAKEDISRYKTTLFLDIDVSSS